MYFKLFLAPIYGAGFTTSTFMLYQKMVDGNSYDIQMKPYTTRFLIGAASLSVSIMWPLFVPLYITNHLDERHQQKISMKK